MSCNCKARRSYYILLENNTNNKNLNFNNSYLNIYLNNADIIKETLSNKLRKNNCKLFIVINNIYKNRLFCSIIKIYLNSVNTVINLHNIILKEKSNNKNLEQKILSLINKRKEIEVSLSYLKFLKQANKKLKYKLNKLNNNKKING